MALDIYAVKQDYEDRIIKWGNAVFKDIYPCRIRAIDMRTMDDIAIRGLNYTGDENFDKQMREELIDCYLTINAMVEYYKDRVNVYLQVKDHSKIIFDTIREYLDAWIDAHESNHARQPPVDDLILLNNFSKAVYTVAKPALEFTPEDKIEANLRSMDLFYNPLVRQENTKKLPEEYHGHSKKLAALMMRNDRIQRTRRT